MIESLKHKNLYDIDDMEIEEFGKTVSLTSYKQYNLIC